MVSIATPSHSPQRLVLSPDEQLDRLLAQHAGKSVEKTLAEVSASLFPAGILAVEDRPLPRLARVRRAKARRRNKASSDVLAFRHVKAAARRAGCAVSWRPGSMADSGLCEAFLALALEGLGPRLRLSRKTQR